MSTSIAAVGERVETREPRQSTVHGHIIRRLRVASGFPTLAALAGRAGITAGYLGRIERGQARPRFGTALRIADEIAVSVHAFWRGY